MKKPFDVSPGAPGIHGTFGHFVEGLAHRLARFAGRALRQYVDTTIGGYSPSLMTRP
jgi:hypothetical protein